MGFEPTSGLGTRLRLSKAVQSTRLCHPSEDVAAGAEGFEPSSRFTTASGFQNQHVCPLRQTPMWLPREDLNLATFRLSDGRSDQAELQGNEYARDDSNIRPSPCKGAALTRLSYARRV